MQQKTKTKPSPCFFGINAKPGLKFNIFLALLPFLLLIILYLSASHLRLQANPSDKLLPSPAKMVRSMARYLFEADEQNGRYLFWDDTLASLRRIGIGILCAALTGLLWGLNMGIFPGMKSLSQAFINFISIIPPLAILPILFITFGTGETGKIMLIFLGTFPLITRDIYITVQKMPRVMITKALTLGAAELEVPYRIILPQLLPKLIDTIRLTLGAAWVYLIAAEAIASQSGLGYRIFLVRRYLAMDVIIPYVLWITLIGFTVDSLLRLLVRRGFPWYVQS